MARKGLTTHSKVPARMGGLGVKIGARFKGYRYLGRVSIPPINRQIQLFAVARRVKGLFIAVPQIEPI